MLGMKPILGFETRHPDMTNKECDLFAEIWSRTASAFRSFRQLASRLSLQG
jgi:hypothetical protein